LHSPFPLFSSFLNFIYTKDGAASVGYVMFSD
jgi:hypothetical protein